MNVPVSWTGVYPALLTPFTAHDEMDLPLFEKNLHAQLDAGVHGFIIGGSLGEASTLENDEKIALLKSALAVCRNQVPVIVNIADLAAFETWRGYIPHAITKAGIVQMTRGLAHALAPKIRVNAVAPGPVLLPEGWTQEQADKLISTTPLGRLGSPEDVAQAVMYLICAEYVTGETIIVDGGRHVRT